MTFDLVVVPNPILKEVCTLVKKMDWKTKELIQAMKKSIWQRNALGISAPQLGVTQRIIVCRYTKDEQEDGVRVYINPELTKHSNITSISVEGCLSIPRVECPVERYRAVNIKYYDENLETQEHFAEEIESFVIQHEIDHLNGILMIEKQVKEDDIDNEIELFN